MSTLRCTILSPTPPGGTDSSAGQTQPRRRSRAAPFTLIHDSDSDSDSASDNDASHVNNRPQRIISASSRSSRSDDEGQGYRPLWSPATASPSSNNSDIFSFSSSSSGDGDDKDKNGEEEEEEEAQEEEEGDDQEGENDPIPPCPRCETRRAVRRSTIHTRSGSNTATSRFSQLYRTITHEAPNGPYLRYYTSQDSSADESVSMRRYYYSSDNASGSDGNNNNNNDDDDDDDQSSPGVEEDNVQRNDYFGVDSSTFRRLASASDAGGGGGGGGGGSGEEDEEASGQSHDNIIRVGWITPNTAAAAAASKAPARSSDCFQTSWYLYSTARGTWFSYPAHQHVSGPRRSKLQRKPRQAENVMVQRLPLQAQAAPPQARRPSWKRRFTSKLRLTTDKVPRYHQPQVQVPENHQEEEQQDTFLNGWQMLQLAQSSQTYYEWVPAKLLPRQPLYKTTAAPLKSNKRSSQKSTKNGSSSNGGNETIKTLCPPPPPAQLKTGWYFFDKSSRIWWAYRVSSSPASSFSTSFPSFLRTATGSVSSKIAPAQTEGWWFYSTTQGRWMLFAEAAGFKRWWCPCCSAQDGVKECLNINVEGMYAGRGAREAASDSGAALFGLGLLKLDNDAAAVDAKEEKKKKANAAPGMLTRLATSVFRWGAGRKAGKA